MPSVGTGLIRYCLTVSEMELGVSIRKGVPNTISEIAISRALDSDVGLSSIAIDPNLNAWVSREYQKDRNSRTLSVYPNPNERRKREYTERMLQKFPNHEVIYL